MRRLKWLGLLLGAMFAMPGIGFAQSFSDDFEGQSLDPWWTKYEQSGSVVFPATVSFPAPAALHSGSQCVEFTSTYNTGQKVIMLYHDFPSGVYGRFSVWMYDTGANADSSNYLALDVLDANSTLAGIGVWDYNVGDAAKFRGAFGSTGFVTNILRTRAWHKLEIVTSPDSVSFSVDDTLVYTSSNGMAVTRVRIRMSGPTWRPAWHGYFDDFEFIDSATLPVAVDIKPGSYPNSINLGSNGVIPVAILSDLSFDATQVDPSTVELAGATVAIRGKSHFLASVEDVNGDGLLDSVFHVETENLLPEEFQDGYAFLTAQTFDGQQICGSDEVTIVPLEP